MDNLLNLLFKTVSVEPRYEEGLCLAAGRTVTCTTCQDTCPHDAIRVGRTVEIDAVDCTGCGLCVHACPTGALQPNVTFEGGASVKCSQVQGSAQTVHCLGRLQASDLLRLLGSSERVTLAHGACSRCPIGAAGVATAMEEARDEALELAALHGRQPKIELVLAEKFDAERPTDVRSRRELLRGGWRSLQERAGNALAPLDPGEDDPALPTEMQRRYRVIAASRPADDAKVPWRLPRIADNCIMCPVCTKACPTDALKRVFEPSGEGVLLLRPDECMDCGACVEACPVGAIEMDGEVAWGELSSGEREAFRREQGRSHDNSVAR